MAATALRDALLALDKLDDDGRSEAWQKLRKQHGDAVFEAALEVYPKLRKAPARLALVFSAIPRARACDAAFRLGLAALSDRATLVRYRACMVVAYSLREDALPELQTLLSHADAKTVADARAAIAAIREKNHHLFLDRQRTGRRFWTVNPGDSP